MRATGRLAVVGAIVLAIAGCRSGGLGWGRKGSATPEPELPTASVTPNNTAPAYAGNTTTPESSAAFAQPPAADYAASAYPGQPAGYDMPPGSGAGAQANYAGGGVMPQQQPYSQGYTQQAPPAGDYAAGGYSTGGYPTTGPGGAYQPPAATPGAAPPMAATPPDPYASVAGGTAAPPASSYGAPPDSGYGAPADPYGTPASSSYGAPADTGYAATPAGSPYPGAADPTAAACNGCGDANCTGGQCAAPSDPYSQDYASTAMQPEQEAAARYGASADYDATSSAAPESATADAGGYRPGSTGYSPGNTGYTPGDTGYSPPGVPKYEMASRPNVVQPAAGDPYYRPGGTSDYIPKTRTPSASTDRYESSVDYSPAEDPYARPDSGGSPAPSPTRMY